MSKELSIIEQVQNYEPLKILFDKDQNGYEKYVASVLNMIKAKPALQKCTPQSVLTCIHNAKTLGLEIDARQLCHLIPYGAEAKLEVDYRGFIYKMEQVLTDFNWKVAFVHKEDEFELWSENDNDFYKHKIKNPFAEAKDAIGIYFAFTYTVNGQKCSRIEKAPMADILKAKAAAKSKNVWETWFSEMGKKFIIRRACKGRFNKNEEIAQLVDYDNKDYEPTVKDVTPTKPTVNNLPDLKPVFVEETKQVDLEEVIAEQEGVQEQSVDKFDLYTTIRQQLIDADSLEKVNQVADFYKQQFSLLNKDQQKDLSNIKKQKMENYGEGGQE
jgi:phage RecT family recombinase